MFIVSSRLAPRNSSREYRMRRETFQPSSRWSCAPVPHWLEICLLSGRRNDSFHSFELKLTWGLFEFTGVSGNVRKKESVTVGLSRKFSITWFDLWFQIYKDTAKRSGTLRALWTRRLALLDVKLLLLRCNLHEYRSFVFTSSSWITQNKYFSAILRIGVNNFRVCERCSPTCGTYSLPRNFSRPLSSGIIVSRFSRFPFLFLRLLLSSYFWRFSLEMTHLKSFVGWKQSSSDGLLRISPEGSAPRWWETCLFSCKQGTISNDLWTKIRYKAHA